MASIEGHDATELLRSTEALRRRARVVQRSFWLPLAIFGLVVVGSGTTCGTADFAESSSANSQYWLLAGGGAYAAVYWYYRRRPLWTLAAT